MKALTIWQPWASLIAVGAKPVEWRGWPAPAHVHGQRIAIHAGARPMKRAEVQDLLHRVRHEPETLGFVGALAEPLLDRALVSPGSLPLSHVLCTAILGRPRPATELVRDSDRVDHSKWGWPLSEIVLLRPPVPTRGAQGFWNWGGA